MASPRRPAAERSAPAPRPTPTAPSDSILESIGKAITDPVREAADATDDAVRKARHDATPDPLRDDVDGAR